MILVLEVQVVDVAAVSGVDRVPAEMMKADVEVVRLKRG
jgi:hypothetical protein